MDKSIRNFVSGPDPSMPEPVETSKMVTLYCYDTMSDADCYFEPQENQNGRFIGVSKKIMPYEQARLLAMKPPPPPEPKLPPVPPPKYAGPMPKNKPQSPPMPDRDISISIGGKTYSSKNIPSEDELKEMEQKEWKKLKNDNDKLWLEQDMTKANYYTDDLPKSSDFFVKKPVEPAADATPAPRDENAAPVKLQKLPE